MVGVFGYCKQSVPTNETLLLTGALGDLRRALRKIVVGRKARMFYGSDTHAEAVSAIQRLAAGRPCGGSGDVP